MLKVSKTNISKYFFWALLLLFWGRDHVVSYAKTVILKLPYAYLVGDYLIPFAVVVCIIGALPYWIKAVSYKDIVFLFAVALAFCFNLLVFRDTQEYLFEIGPAFWLSVFPVYFIGLRINAQEEMKMIYRLSLINVWMLLFVTMVFGDPMSETRALYQGAMGRAYNLLPQLMVIFVFMLSNPNLWNISTFTVGTIYLFSCGTRGAILCLFVFVFVFILLRKPLREHLLMYGVLLVLMILMLVFYEEILLGLKFIAGEAGMSERTINKLLSGKFFVSEGRNALKDAVVEGLLDRPMLGYGIAGDRTLIGIYVHNIVLELLISYGIPLGLALTGAILFLICRGYQKAHTDQGRNLILLLTCGVMIKLLMSGTYLQEELFFLLLGVCVGQMRGSASLELCPEATQKETKDENM